MPPRRPREVPVAKPSAAEIYVPKVLLRDDKGGRARGKGWMPTERRPGASKHLTATHHSDIMKTRVDTNEYCTESEVDKLQALEQEVVMVLETEAELEAFVREFYVAAATFSTQAAAQKTLLTRLRSKNMQAQGAI